MTDSVDLTAIKRAARDVLARLGGETVDPAAVLPADIPLELSGEAVRARLCIFTDASGAERVMRPDLTLPIADAEAARRVSGQDDPITLQYAARAFRLPVTRHDPMEFTQIGVERFGYEASPAADAELFAAICDAATASGVAIDRIAMGDLSIFPAFVDALGLAASTNGLLKRAFRQSGGVRKLLAETSDYADLELGNALAALEPDAARQKLLETLEARGIELIGARSADEIVASLIAKADAARVGGVPNEARELLEKVLAVSAAPDDAVEALYALAREAGLTPVLPYLDVLAARNDAMRKSVGADIMRAAEFLTPFGRRFNYYDGFVFEVFGIGADARHPLASGGRYDALIRDLSLGEVSATALGGVVRPDRIAISMSGGAA